jgi:hypothetical protein
MDALLQSAALVLGLAISLHTVYSIAHNHVVRAKERRGLIEQFRIEFGIPLSLITIVAGKARRFGDKYLAGQDPLLARFPESAENEFKIITTRADQILELRPNVDLPRVAASLSRTQLRLLVEFLDNYRLYRLRLQLRRDEYRNAPEQPGTLGRFLSCTQPLGDERLTERFVELQRALGLREETETRQEGEAA